MVVRRQVEALAALGLSQSEIASDLRVSRQRVHQLFRGYSTLDDKGTALEVHRAQAERCAACHQRIEFDRGQIHHLVPVTNGGNHHGLNLVFVCRPCHRAIHRGLLPVPKWLLSPVRAEWPQALDPSPRSPFTIEYNPRARNLLYLRDLIVAVHPRAEAPDA